MYAWCPCLYGVKEAELYKVSTKKRCFRPHRVSSDDGESSPSKIYKNEISDLLMEHEGAAGGLLSDGEDEEESEGQVEEKATVNDEQRTVSRCK